MQVTTVLLQFGAKPNLAHEVTGETPLMRAALNGHIDLTRLLLEYGADVTQLNLEGTSVLDLLADESYSNVVELCTQYVDCNKPNATSCAEVKLSLIKKLNI